MASNPRLSPPAWALLSCTFLRFSHHDMPSIIKASEYLSWNLNELKGKKFRLRKFQIIPFLATNLFAFPGLGSIGFLRHQDV